MNWRSLTEFHILSPFSVRACACAGTLAGVRQFLCKWVQRNFLKCEWGCLCALTFFGYIISVLASLSWHIITTKIRPKCYNHSDTWTGSWIIEKYVVWNLCFCRTTVQWHIQQIKYVDDLSFFLLFPCWVNESFLLMRLRHAKTQLGHFITL